MEMIVDFPGGARVDAHFGRFQLHTDQTVADGGADSAPSPFDLFLASIGTCAGFYVLGFCRQRRLPTDGLRLVQRLVVDEDTGHVDQINLEIELPPDFPEKYRLAVIRAAQQCTVKKHLQHPPVIAVTTCRGEPLQA